MSQGDIFDAIPQVMVLTGATGALIIPNLILGVSLLVSHGCTLDKASRGASTIERLQFIPLLDLGQQDSNRQALVRREQIAPAEAIYVGPVPGVGEAYGLLSEMYQLPAVFFGAHLQAFPSTGGEEANYLVSSNGPDRLGRLEDNRVALLHQKMVAFWTRSRIA